MEAFLLICPTFYASAQEMTGRSDGDTMCSTAILNKPECNNADWKYIMTRQLTKSIKLH